MEAAAVELPREDREDRDAGWLLRRRTPYEGEGVGPGSAGSRAGIGSIEAAPEGGQAVSRDGGAAREDGRAWPLGTALDRGGSCSEGAVAALFLCSSEWTWSPSDSQMELMPRRAAALARRKSAGGGARSSIMSGERERGGAEPPAPRSPGAPTHANRARGGRERADVRVRGLKKMNGRNCSGDATRHPAAPSISERKWTPTPARETTAIFETSNPQAHVRRARVTPELGPATKLPTLSRGAAS